MRSRPLSVLLATGLLAGALVLLVQMHAPASAAALSRPVLSVRSSGYASIVASWTPAADATGYRLYRATSSHGAWSRIATVTAGATYTDGGRKTGRTYYYKVRSYRIQGASLVFGSYSAVHAARAVPARPSTAARSAGLTSVAVSWGAVAGATGFRVYRATSSRGDFMYLKTITSATGCTDSGRKTGKTYYYKVRAYHVESGTKVLGGLSAAATAAPCPNAVSNLMVSRLASPGLKLTWAAASGASGYEVARAASSAGTFAALVTTAAATWTNTDLPNGATYYYKVRAYHVEDGRRVFGPYSSVVGFELASAWTHLDEGNILGSGQVIGTANGQYTLSMQTDGNLVLRYKSSGRVLWHSSTAGNAGASFRVQHDGNAVVVSSAGVALWSSGTSGKSAPQVRPQEDGTLVVLYAGGSKAIAGVNSVLGVNDRLDKGNYINSGDKRYLFVMQTDGNLVLYSTDPWKALWATGTSGDNYAVMQSDGNLVVYRQGGGALWASGTSGIPGAWLTLQNDANVVIYTTANAAVWSRTTGRIYAGDNPIFPLNLSAGAWYGLTYWGHDVYGAYQYSAIDLNMLGDADNGQPIYAIQDGVMTVGTDCVWVRHTKPLVLKNGTQIATWYSMYGHLARNTAIGNGATVAKGTVLGWVSHNGADNNHLHFVIFRNFNNARASAISPWWLPGVYSNNDRLYADDPYGTRQPPGLYEATIFTNPPTQ